MLTRSRTCRVRGENAVEDLLDEVVRHCPVRADQVVDELGRLRGGEGGRGEAQARGPAPGRRDQRGHELHAEHVPGGREHRRGLVRGEPELLGPHLDELPAARSLPRGIGGSRRPDSTTRTCGGRSRSSTRSPSTAAGSFSSSVLSRTIVSGSGRACRPSATAARKSASADGSSESAGRAAGCRRPRRGSRATPEQDRPEPAGAVVDGRQRHPHRVHGVGAQPVGEQRRLPPARGRADQHDVARASPRRAGRAAVAG